MFCESCGREIAVQAKFCCRCGQAVDDESTSVRTTLSWSSTPKQVTPFYPQPQKSNNLPTYEGVLIAFLIAAFVCLVGVGIITYINQQKQEQAKQQETTTYTTTPTPYTTTVPPESAPPKPMPEVAPSLGVYIAKSSETIPAFPRAWSGYRYTGNNKDFWDNTFDSRGTIRIFEINGWTGIYDFPATMNNCGSGVFMIRWRSSNPDVRLATALGFNTMEVSSAVKTGNFGYMYGTNCEQPMFKFAGTLNGNESNLVDVYYELKFWRAAP